MRGLQRVVCIVGASLVAAYAQQPLQAGGSGYFGIGVNWVQVGELSRQLQNAGYGELRSWMVGIGGGGTGRIRRLLIGGEGYGLVEQKAAAMGKEARLSGGYGFFTLGYTVAEPAGVSLALLGGIGGGSLGLSLVRDSTIGFGELLANPAGAVELRTGGWLLQAGVVAEAVFARGLLLTVRAGWILPLGWSGFEIGDRAVAGAPKATLGGAYVRVGIGGSSPRRRMRDGD